MEQNVPLLPETDDSKEGTAAHEIGETALRGEYRKTAHEFINVQMRNGVIATPDMADYVKLYIDHVQSRCLPIYVEQEMICNFLPDITIPGHPDAAMFDERDGTLYIEELKYGYRPVEVEWHWPMFWYDVMFANLVGMRNVKRVVNTIIQPRPYHPLGRIRSETIDILELNARFAKASEIAKVIVSDNPPTVTGSHCHYCPAFYGCPAAQAAGMNAVDVSNRAVVHDMPNRTLAAELTTLMRAKEMLANRESALIDVARNRIKEGNNIPGWTLDKSYGKTKWLKNINTPMLEALLGSKATETKMVTPAAAERAGLPEDVVKSFTDRPFKGWKLAAIDLDKQAKEVFK